VGATRRRRGLAYLTDELHPGDQLEVRRPIRRWFIWDASDAGPLLLVAGGSGA
jgi:ferredoxin-NADP reductase